MFVDESGHAHHTQNDPNNPFLTVCGVLFTDEAYRPFRKAFRALKEDVFGRTDIVFHSRDIRKRQGVFRVLKDDAINVYFITKLNQIISEASFTVVAVVVDKKHYMRIYPFSTFDIYLIALELMMERVLYRLQPKDLPPEHSKNTVKILAEARGRNEDERLLRAFNRIMDRGNDHNPPARFRSLFSGLAFKRKAELIDGLELADLCAYPIGKHCADPFQSHPSYPIIQPKLLKNPKGLVEGAGVKRFPDPNKTKSLWTP